MSWISARTARVVVEMRHLICLLNFVLAAETLCAAGATAEEIGTGDLGVWHLSVFDVGVRRDQRPSSADAAVRTVSNVAGWETPGSRSRAAWSLQLGMVRPPHAYRTHFGPSDGIPLAGDFNGDGLAEMAMFLDGRWYLDLNGNSTWDRDDLCVAFGRTGDRPIVGDWNQDGKDDLGVVTPAATAPHLVQQASFNAPALHEPGLPHPLNPLRGTSKNAGLLAGRALGESVILSATGEELGRVGIRHAFRFGESEGIPVVGDWTGTGVVAVGTFRDGRWRLDIDGDGRWTDADRTVTLGEPGDLPIVGDFNRDGRDDLGIYRRGLWQIDTSGDLRLSDEDLTYRLGDDGDTPVVGDWDGDGRDQIGVVRREANGSRPPPVR